MSARRRWAAGALLVALGAGLSPQLVPVYDGIATPDEPYRYVTAPAGAPTTKPATAASLRTPVRGGLSTDGLSVATAEQGPQFSLFIPPGGLRTAAGATSLDITVTPTAPTDAPPTTTAQGNVYDVGLAAAAGPVTLTDAAALATLYLRATNQKVPQPSMYYRPAATAAWSRLQTTAGGLDVRVASFKGAGQYLLALAPVSASASASSGGGPPVVPVVLIVVLLVLVGIVFVIRLRSPGPEEHQADPVEG